MKNAVRFVFDGEKFKFDEVDPGLNVIYLVYDSKLEHYGLTTAKKDIYSRYLGRNDIQFCHTCAEMYTSSKIMNEKLSCLIEHFKSRV